MQWSKVIKNQYELSYVTEKGERKVLPEVIKFFSTKTPTIVGFGTIRAKAS